MQETICTAITKSGIANENEKFIKISPLTYMHKKIVIYTQYGNTENETFIFIPMFIEFLCHFIICDHRHLFHTWVTLTNKTPCFISKGGPCMKQVPVSVMHNSWK